MSTSVVPRAIPWKQAIFLTLAAFLVCSYLYLPYSLVEIPSERVRANVRYLLIWGDPTLYPLTNLGIGTSAFEKNKCLYTNCFVTSNKNFFTNVTTFDAIVFNGREIDEYLKGVLPRKRSARQKYVYANMESSHNYPVCSSFFDNFFNWTWTYRLDSDSRLGYFNIYNSTGDEIGPQIDMHWPKLDQYTYSMNNWTIKLTDSKTTAAAWFVSNCYSKSNRKEVAHMIAKELNKYGHSLHVYGSCGKYTCSRSNADRCYRKLAKHYYFYFAFENSLADDYVTEKVLTALNNYAIPVVLGAANYSRFLPPGSYLNANEMTPEDLAKSMVAIIRSHRTGNSSLYYNFFRWREYKYSFRVEAENSDMCKLCQLMNDHELMSRHSAYENFSAWWNSKYANCS